MLSEWEYARLLEMVQFDESKDRFINRNSVLSQKEKDFAIAFFQNHTNLESKVDWNEKDDNKLATSILELIDATEESARKNKEKRKVYKELPNFDKNWRIYRETDDWIYAMPLNWNACKYADSHECGGQGAKWCIGYEESDKYWNDYYYDYKSAFVFCFNKNCTVSEDEFTKLDGDSPEKLHSGQKYMLQLRTSQIVIWDKDDNGSYYYGRTEWKEEAERHEDVPCLFNEIEFDEFKTIMDFYENLRIKEFQEKERAKKQKEENERQYFVDSMKKQCELLNVDYSGNNEVDMRGILKAALNDTTVFPLHFNGISVIDDSDGFVMVAISPDEYFEGYDGLEHLINNNDKILDSFKTCLLGTFRYLLYSLWNSDVSSSEILGKSSTTVPLIVLKKNRLDDILSFRVKLEDTRIYNRQVSFDFSSIYFPGIYEASDSTFDLKVKYPDSEFFDYDGQNYFIPRRGVVSKPFEDYFIDKMSNDSFKDDIMEYIVGIKESLIKKELDEENY